MQKCEKSGSYIKQPEVKHRVESAVVLLAFSLIKYSPRHYGAFTPHALSAAGNAHKATSLTPFHFLAEASKVRRWGFLYRM